MAQSTTNYVIQGSTKGFTEAARAVASTNKVIQDSQAAQLKMARDLAAALGMLKEKAQGTSKAIDAVSGGGKTVPSGTSMTGSVGTGGGKSGGKAGGDIGGILDALTKFGSGNGKQKIQELSTLFHKLRLDALGAAAAINAAGAAMGGTSAGGGAGGSDGGGVIRGAPPAAGSGGSGGGGGRRAKPGRGGFTQGLLEGSLPNGLGRVLQRGPGVFAQAGGQALGGFGRGLAAMPFSGAAGVSGMLGSIPVAGGALSAISGRSIAQVSAAVAQAKQTQGLNPYLGKYGRGFDDPMHLFVSSFPERDMAQMAAYDQRAKARRGLYQGTDLETLGLKHGMDFPSAQQFAGQYAAGSGRMADDARNTGGINTAMALNNVYGVSAQTLGTYNRGANDGLKGLGMRGAMTDVARATSMGIRAPDMSGYLDRSAAGVAQFETTGFRPDPAAIGGLGGAFKNMGITGLRAENSARGVEAGVQNIGMNGPQGGSDLMMMQELGYDGSEQSGAKVMRQMRSGNLGKQGGQAIAHVLQKVSRMAGGGEYGHFAALKTAQKYHMAVDDDGIDDILRNEGNTSFAVSPKLRKQLEANISDQSENMVDPITRRQNKDNNMNLDTGVRMSESVQKLEMSVDNLASSFSTLANPILSKFAHKLSQATSVLRATQGPVGSSVTEAAIATSPKP